MGDERRDSPRFAWPIAVLTERRRAMHIGDVSLGGVRFFAPSCFVSDELVIGIRLPKRVLRLRGRVSSLVRAADEGFDIRVLFKNPDVLDELALAAWLHQKSQGVA